MSHRNMLNSGRRRMRKEQLARRDGQYCTYCLRPFATLREATLDHVVPFSLMRTSSARHLVLACRPCNRRKADRLPLSIALLLVWSIDPVSTGVHPTGPVFTPDQSTFTRDGSAFTGPDRSADSEPPPDPTRLGPEHVDWLTLARLVHARSAADRSMCDQPKRVDRRVRVGRLEHPRRSARMNTCEQPTARGVSA